ncbi:hypothetical protein MCESTEE72_00534 [Candidatus Methylopumilus universalis]
MAIRVISSEILIYQFNYLFYFYQISYNLSLWKIKDAVVPGYALLTQKEYVGVGKNGMEISY